MENQIAFFNLAHQIIWHYPIITKKNAQINNLVKDDFFDKYNNYKEVILLNDKNETYFEEYLTNNKINIHKFNFY